MANEMTKCRPPAGWVTCISQGAAFSMKWFGVGIFQVRLSSGFCDAIPTAKLLHFSAGFLLCRMGFLVEQKFNTCWVGPGNGRNGSDEQGEHLAFRRYVTTVGLEQAWFRTLIKVDTNYFFKNERFVFSLSFYYIFLSLYCLCLFLLQ